MSSGGVIDDGYAPVIREQKKCKWCNNMDPAQNCNSVADAMTCSFRDPRLAQNTEPVPRRRFKRALSPDKQAELNRILAAKGLPPMQQQPQPHQQQPSDPVQRLIDEEQAQFDAEELLLQQAVGDLDAPTPPPPQSVSDPVTRPNHYARFKIEPIEFCMVNDLPFWCANVIKYVCRWDAKDGIQDLRKARRYLDMKIKQLEGDPNFAR